MVAGIMASGNGSVNRESNLLSRDENNQVMRLLGSRCESLATSVIQLFMTEPPDHGSWIKRESGILCLVKDHLKRSYFLRLYCLQRRTLLWEHEVYNAMEYNAVRPFLHTFEGQDGIVGFNFASEEDARATHEVLLQKLDRKQRRMERKSRLSYTSTSNRQSMSPPASSAVNGSFSYPRPMQTQQPPPLPPQPRGKKEKGSGGKKQGLTKADIGMPLDFRHVSHVGWDPNKGFDVNVDDPQLKHFFVKAGVSDSQLQDKETREFIYDFINQHGGLDAVKEEELIINAPPVPARIVTKAAPAPPRSLPPPPPPISTSHQPGPPPPPMRNIAPPPPPPPLPPPAPAPMSEVPPPPLPVASNQHVPDSHSALMDAIKSGKPLKRAEEVKQRPQSGEDSRNDLLGQIRLGTQLKPVQHVPKPAAAEVPTDSLAGALARALAERNRANHSDSDSGHSDTPSDEEDEWED